MRYLINTAVAALAFTVGLLANSLLPSSHLHALSPLSKETATQPAAEPDDPGVRIRNIFCDFDLVESSPITYRFAPSLEKSFLDAVDRPHGTTLRPLPEKLELEHRYTLYYHGSTIGDPFYQFLVNRFHYAGIETSIFIPHSAMSVVTDPVLPTRFTSAPSMVLQPTALIFRGKGYKGLVIRDEYEQTSGRGKPNLKTDDHVYSVIIWRET